MDDIVDSSVEISGTRVARSCSIVVLVSDSYINPHSGAMTDSSLTIPKNKTLAAISRT